jgi:hypothetical protein
LCGLGLLSNTSIPFPVASLVKEKHQKIAKFTIRYLVMNAENSETEASIRKALNLSINLPLSVLGDFAELVLLAHPNPSTVRPATQVLLGYALTVQPSEQFARSCMRRPIPVESDFILDKPARSRVIEKTDRFFAKFMRIFPTVFQDDCLPKLFEVLKRSSVLIILSLCDTCDLPNLPQVFLGGHLAAAAQGGVPRCLCEAAQDPA